MCTPKRLPASPFRLSKLLVVAAALGLAAALAACGPQYTPGPGSTGAAETSATTPATPSPSTSPAAPSPRSTTSATTPAAPTPSPSAPSATPEPTPSSAASTTPAETPLCTGASLTGALDSNAGGGAAGSVYMSLVLTNSSAVDCIVDGYPGVSLVKAGTIDWIGAEAMRDENAPSNGPITLAPGTSASAVLRYTQADNYQDCQREQADAVLVYPPSATDYIEIAHPLTACSNADIALLSIGAFQP